MYGVLRPRLQGSHAVEGRSAKARSVFGYGNRHDSWGEGHLKSASLLVFTRTVEFARMVVPNNSCREHGGLSSYYDGTCTRKDSFFFFFFFFNAFSPCL